MREGGDADSRKSHPTLPKYKRGPQGPRLRFLPLQIQIRSLPQKTPSRKSLPFIVHHQDTEYLSITHSHVPSFCRRATSEVTVPSRLRVEVRARSPQMSAGRCSPNSNFRFSGPNPVTWSFVKNSWMASLPRRNAPPPMSTTASGSNNAV